MFNADIDMLTNGTAGCIWNAFSGLTPDISIEKHLIDTTHRKNREVRRDDYK